MGPQAVAAAREAMRDAHRNRFARPRAFTLHLEATGHLHTGDIDRACATGHQLLDMAAQLSSTRVTNRVRVLLRSLTPYQNVTEVHDLYEAARTLLAAPGR